ncbi:MAG: polyphosphate polymerase domain-containing protein [Dehalococcoidia bacterium]|nr:polyphosphate polymerase domain-containing protein [Dehalococcoidia bacterium]
MLPQFAPGPALLEALPQAPLRDDLGGQLVPFEPVSLAEMDSVALFERRDTKFVLSETRLAAFLEALAGRYRVLEIDDTRVHGYRTVYFDTPGLGLFYDHHNARARRFKVRSRMYVDSHASYFEIKAKDGRENTVKSRTRTQRMVTAVSPVESTFIETHAPYPLGELAPRLLNSFSRITLVDLERGERLTLDLGLTFAANGEVAGLPGLVVAELKQPRAAHDSPFLALARETNLHPSGFSKYCIGVSLLYPGIKHNAFNPELRLARRITGATDVR